jgi:CheY-like chemotaxis protein
LTVTSDKKDGNIRISIKDNGTGMSEETKSKIFNPFFTTKQVDEGTGLGLSLSHSIVLEHNGTIDVVSELGKGTTFIITLPVTTDAPDIKTDASKPSPIVAEKTETKHILVLDDEEPIRRLLNTFLTRNGYRVDVTGDTEKALKHLYETNYDVVLMDIRMPGKSGMELYAQVKERYPEYVDKFIFITGDTSDADIGVFLDSNKLSYITKPFDLKELLSKVKAVS